MKNVKIAIIGLGYVGLPLAVEFAKKFPVVGFDLKKERVDELNKGHDATLEVADEILTSLLTHSIPYATGKGIFITDDPRNIKDANYYIITVPTPTDKNNRPVLTPLIKASETVGAVLKKGDTVIYESTVYPGCTEEDCVPVLEAISRLKFNRDFFAGYSPERINPGDKEHTVSKIKKITSGSTPAKAKEIDELYNTIITAGTHSAPSIKVAEAAKVIENAQRDVNIAFVNELAKIFNNLKIDTTEVLQAAGTKWNFLQFKPGLVGGHCIGVDPYYLAQKAQETGYNPEIILAGRRINDGMGQWIASQIVKLMINKGHTIKNSKVLVLGITFKENCPDIRNTKAIDVISELEQFGCNVAVYDPWADKDEVKKEYEIDLLDTFEAQNYDTIVLAVAHNEFTSLDPQNLKGDTQSVIYDIKGIWDKSKTDGRL